MNEVKDLLTNLAVCSNQAQLQRVEGQIWDAWIDGKISAEVSKAFNIIIDELKHTL